MSIRLIWMCVVTEISNFKDAPPVGHDATNINSSIGGNGDDNLSQRSTPAEYVVSPTRLLSANRLKPCLAICLSRIVIATLLHNLKIQTPQNLCRIFRIYMRNDENLHSFLHGWHSRGYMNVFILKVYIASVYVHSVTASRLIDCFAANKLNILCRNNRSLLHAYCVWNSFCRSTTRKMRRVLGSRQMCIL